ncbi:MAG: CBS domain-containing protein [Thaumarchaeota archaeon]|nr:CBS domain-containing protein [Nitrososphaerota archaeon]
MSVGSQAIQTEEMDDQMVLYAKDIVESDFISLTPDTSALEAAKLMKEKKHGFAIIIKDGKPYGIVTEWDYLSKIVAEGKSAATVNLKEIMTENLVTVQGNLGIDAVSKLMAEKGIRRILVMERDRLVGVITSKTILSRLEEYINRVSAQIARLQSPF